MNTLDSSFKLLMYVLILGWSSSCISPHNFINRKLLQQLTLPHKCVYVAQVTEVEGRSNVQQYNFLNQQKIQSEVHIIPVGGWCNWTCGLIQWEKSKTAADAFHHSILAPCVWTWNPKTSTWIMVRKKFNMRAHLPAASTREHSLQQ